MVRRGDTAKASRMGSTIIVGFEGRYGSSWVSYEELVEPSRVGFTLLTSQDLLARDVRTSVLENNVLNRTDSSIRFVFVGGGGQELYVNMSYK